MVRFWLMLSVAGLLAGPAIAQTAGASAQPPVPAVPPPTSHAGMSAGQVPTNPPELIGRPASPAPGSPPLTGSAGGATDRAGPSNPRSLAPSR